MKAQPAHQQLALRCTRKPDTAQVVPFQTPVTADGTGICETVIATMALPFPLLCFHYQLLTPCLLAVHVHVAAVC